MTQADNLVAETFRFQVGMPKLNDVALAWIKIGEAIRSGGNRVTRRIGNHGAAIAYPAA